MPQFPSPRSLLLAGCAALATAHGASAQSVSFRGQTFKNQGLAGVGRVSPQLRDGFGDTLGSLGSGMVADLTRWRRNGDSYSGVFFMLPDRGYNIAGTIDYQGRLQQMGVAFTPLGTSGSTGQQNQIQLNLQQTIGLRDNNGVPTTGLDPTGFRAAGNGFPILPTGSNGRVTLDNEGIVRGRDGTFYVSDEYGPYIYRYRADGTLIGAIRPPNALIPIRNGQPNFASNNPPVGQAAPVPADPVTGRQNNQGFEGLAISPDGRQLTAVLQSAARQDGGTGGSAATRNNTRLLTYDISNPAAPVETGHYVVQLPRFTAANGTTLVAAQSEVLALNRSQYLMIARDSGNGFTYPTPTSLYRQILLVDTSGATNIKGTAFEGTTPVAPGGVLASGITPAATTPFININDGTQLGRFGLRNGAPNNSNNLYEKWEAMTLLPVLDRRRPNDFFLVVANDSDFIARNGSMNGASYSDPSGQDVDNMFLVYRVTLPTYVDPLALQSLEVTALPLARATGESAMAVGRTLLGHADTRLFGLRTGQDMMPRGDGAEVPAVQPRWNTFVAGNFNFSSLGSNSMAAYAYGPTGGSLGRASTDPSVRAATAGMDYRFTPNLRAGLSVSYFDSSASLWGGTRIDGTGGAISPFITATHGNSYLDLQYSYVFGDWDIRRDTGIYGLTGRGKPGGEGHLVALSAGHNFRSGGFVYGPLARFTHSSMSVDRYTETDAVHANASVPRQTATANILSLGMQGSHPMQFQGGWRVTPQLRAGWDFALSDDNRNMTIGLSERLFMPEAYVTGPVGTRIQSGFRGGAGVRVQRGAASVLVDYDVRSYQGGGGQSHAVTIALGYSF
ncbi:esterase-like activity of phytase family protein [Roseococcus sp.]|uniref:esterase-like activity of phytase family protein n=1 Tax=Roseococcus sp. TaxID=2109646 RepID=UPI003BA98920